MCVCVCECMYVCVGVGVCTRGVCIPNTKVYIPNASWWIYTVVAAVYLQDPPLKLIECI